MKFTQNEAVKKISSILTRGGKDQQLSDRTIAENIDSLMKAMVTDETELDDFIKTVEPLFKTWQANAKKDSSDFINKWKEEHPEPEPQPAPKADKGNDENPELKALLDRIAVLEADKAKATEQEAIAAKRKDVQAKLKEKGVTDETWINNFISEVNITTDLDVDAKAEAWVKLYNKSVANNGNSVPPVNPQGGGGDGLDSLKAASQMAKRNREIQEQAMK